MRHIVLDFSEIENQEELHDLLQEVLELPTYYGRNLDALWDCLSEVRDYLLIELIGIHTLFESVGPYSAKLLHTLDEAAEKNPYIWLKVRESFLFDDL